MPEKTPLRSIQNALAFEVKRPCVLNQMHLRFFEGCRGLLPGSDEVFSVRHNSSVLKRAHVRARTNYIM